MMALKTNRLSIAAALAAGVSLIATPVAAAGLPAPSHVQVRNADYDAAADRRRGGRDWNRHRGHDRIDGGDILTGLLVLGGIAVIAGAANNSNRDRAPDYPVIYPEDSRSTPSGTYRSGGMDRAVEVCVGEVERRNAEVGEVDSASRGADGWFVSGSTTSGAPWACRIGNDGQVDSVDVGDNSRAEYDASDGSIPGPGQYDDTTYARARADRGQVSYIQR